MSALAQELPHPHPGQCHEWRCEWCDTDGIADAVDLIPDVCPECGSARLMTRDLWSTLSNEWWDEEDQFHA